MKRAILFQILLFILPATLALADSPIQFQLSNTIGMPAFDMIGLSTDGTNLLVLNNSTPDMVDEVTTSGSLIRSFNTPSNFNMGIAYNGTSVIFANGTNISGYFLRTMNPTTGATSGPLSSELGTFTSSLLFNGTELFMGAEAQGTSGTLSIPLTEFNPSTFAITGTTTLTVNTGSTITATTVLSLGYYQGDYFVGLQGIPELYQFDSNGNVIAETSIPADNDGIAFINNNLYVAVRGAKTIYEYEQVPEPSTWIMIAAGSISLLMFRSRKSLISFHLRAAVYFTSRSSTSKMSTEFGGMAPWTPFSP
jgi:hypothetical protein